MIATDSLRGDFPELTAQEYRVAVAVGSGRSNKSVARSLTVTIKTVEFHLGNIYRKLGLSSRTALANLISERSSLPRSSARRDEVVGNLPGGRGPLVGRAAEVGELLELIRRHPLVTVTGVAGVGKTRLALAVAADARSAYRDGAWLVELGSVEDGKDVASACGVRLGLRLTSRMPSGEDVASALMTQERLLIIDNCEHVLAAATELACAIVHRSPGTTVMTTSRERLDVAEERVFPLRPLSLGTGDIATSPAAELFTERAAAAAGTFAPTAVDLPIVERICQRLDGLPLAIELAAARMSSLDLDSLSQRLDDRFNVLVRNRGTDRQHSLFTAIDWSYNLLSPEERCALEDLSVFSGDFDLDAACAVIDSGSAARDLVASLVDRSLVVVSVSSGRSRYLLLETIREFAMLKLRSHGDELAARRRHLDHFMSFVRAANEGVRGPDELMWHRAIETDWHNIRSTMTTIRHLDDGHLGCELVREIFWWALTRMRTEVGSWSDEILLMPSARDCQLRIVALASSSYFAAMAGERERALALLAEARIEENQRGELAEPWVPGVAVFIVDFGEILDFTRETICRARATGSTHWESVGELQASVILQYLVNSVSDPVTVAGYMEQIRASCTVADANGNPNGISFARMILGGALRSTDPEHAETLLRECLELAVPLGLELPAAQARVTLAALYVAEGRPLDALDVVISDIRIHLLAGAPIGMLIFDLRACLIPLIDIGEAIQAAMLLGALRSIEPSEKDAELLSLVEARLHDTLSDAEISSLTQRGHDLGLDAVARSTTELIVRRVSTQPGSTAAQSD